MSLDNGLLSFRHQDVTQFNDDVSSIRAPENLVLYSLNSSKKMLLKLTPTQCQLVQPCTQGMDK